MDYWDVNALADAIYGVLNYTILSKLLAIKRRNEVKKLKWEKQESKYEMYITL